MQTAIIDIMNEFGYLGIALLIAVENIFPPIPSEVILTVGGFMTTYTSMKIWGVITAATIGSILGALILYGVGRWLNPDRLDRWVDGRLGKLLHLKKEDIHRAEKWFERRGKLTVFFCRFIPIIRSLISIPAGISRMHMGVFILLTALGTAIWNIVLVYFGVFLGGSWKIAVEYMNTYSLITAIVFAVLAVILVFVFYRKRIKKKPAAQDTEPPADNSEE